MRRREWNSTRFTGLNAVLFKRVRSLALVACFVFAGLSSANALVITFGPTDYDNAQNVLNPGPTPVYNQTFGYFRDVFWWGTATGVGDNDYINRGKNLISNGGTPARAVVGGDDDALNFTGVRIPNGGKNFLTVFDTTPADGPANRDLFDFSKPGGQTISADVLFAPGNHAGAAGVVALYSEDQYGLALLAHNGGGGNNDVPRLSLVFQSPGNAVLLESAGPFVGTTIQGDTNGAVATGSNSGDHWYRVILNVSVSGDTWTAAGEFWNHSDPTDPNSPLGAMIAALNDNGSLSDPNPAAGVDLRVLTNPGEIGLMASVFEPFSDGINTVGGGTPANPLVDNVGVSITNFDPGIVPEPSSATLALIGLLGMVQLSRRRRKV